MPIQYELKKKSKQKQTEQQQQSSRDAKSSEEPQTFLHSNVESVHDEAEKKKLEMLPELIQAEVRSLEGISYYHGMTDRDTIEPKLTRRGDFVVRATDNRTGKFEFVLTIYNSKRIYSHLVILVDLDKKKWWLAVNPSQLFNNIVDMARYYQEQTLGPHFKLGRAISKGPHLIPPDRIIYNPTKDLLGTGSFSEVYRAHVLLEHGMVLVAVKNSKLLDEKLDPTKNSEANKVKKEMITEAEVMSQLRHSNITQFFGIAVDRLPVLIVMEFCQGGNMESHLVRFSKRISFSEKMLYIADATAGLSYIHSMAVTHRDLASRNLLISVNGFVKLSDFGLGIKLRRADGVFIKKKGARCPARWMAPEMFSKGTCLFSKATDVWSMGATMYEIFMNGEVPHEDLDNREAMIAIRNGKAPKFPESAGPFNERLATQLFAIDPSHRITAEMLSQEVLEYVRVDQNLSLKRLTLNEIRGVRRQRLTHFAEYTPQVIVINEDGKDLGYQDAPCEMLSKVVRKKW
uniref:Tyrosine-protein kinase n=1 Tax=Caenorhabditis japonica TaxID=281687 RepID=A0A8R1HMX0_CAEJA